MCACKTDVRTAYTCRMVSTAGAATQPTVFLSHGAPPLADDPVWPGELRAWSASLAAEFGRPRAVLIVSAHWEANPVTVSSTTGAPLVYDFWGFPARYSQVRYDAPPAPQLADAVSDALAGAMPLARDESRGLDHGAYVPLVELFPQADIPVLQLSMPTLEPATLVELGRLLAPLRRESVLIIGSGFTTHNLAWFDPRRAPDAPAPAASVAFDAWAADVVGAGDDAALVAWQTRAPDPLVAHPRSEHWAPLYVALGAALGDRAGAARTTCAIEGFWYGLSKRSWVLN